MTRESLQTELKEQEEHLNWLRQTFHIDQNHRMNSRAAEIQKLIDEINDDINRFPNAPSYRRINEELIRNVKSQIDRLKKVMFVRN